MDEALEDVGESSAKGQRHGLVTCALSSVGSCRMVRRYTGKWVDGKRCGLGVSVEANGCMTTGYLKNDQSVCSRTKLVKAAVTVQRYAWAGQSVACAWSMQQPRCALTLVLKSRFYSQKTRRHHRDPSPMPLPPPHSTFWSSTNHTHPLLPPSLL
jgi:hypothetical protein